MQNYLCHGDPNHTRDKVKFLTKIAASFPPWVHKAWHHIEVFFSITDQRHMFLFASGIAFSQLICLIPLTLLGISVVSAIIGEVTTKSAVVELSIRFLPGNANIIDAVNAVIQEVRMVFEYNTLTGWIGGLALLWTASALFSAMRTGLNNIFHIETKRIFIFYRIKDMIMTVTVALLILVTTLISPILSLVETYSQTLLPDGAEQFFFGATAQVVSIIATSILFLTLYRFVPNKRLPWQIVWVSTVAAVVLWESARMVFTWYVNSTTAFSTFYGGYVAIISLALWMYYSSIVFLLCAELGQYIYVVRQEHHPPAP